MLKRIVVPAALFASLVSADTLVLKSGRTIEGDYLGGTTRTIRMQVGEKTESFNISNVSEIRFGAAASPEPAHSAGTLTPRRRDAQQQDLNRSAEPSLPARTVTASPGRLEVPSGTTLAVRMIDDVDSQRDAVGSTFKASIDEAVYFDGRVVIPRDTDVVVKLIDDKESGKLSGRTELTLDLVSLTLNGRTVDVMSQEITQASESRTSRSTKVVGGAAALGAIIGAIAGGGKGAAIGGLSGAAAGGAVQVLTKGQRVRIPSETRLTFTLQQPLRP